MRKHKVTIPQKTKIIYSRKNAFKQQAMIKPADRQKTTKSTKINNSCASLAGTKQAQTQTKQKNKPLHLLL